MKRNEVAQSTTKLRERRRDGGQWSTRGRPSWVATYEYELRELHAHDDPQRWSYWEIRNGCEEEKVSRRERRWERKSEDERGRQFPGTEWSFGGDFSHARNVLGQAWSRMSPRPSAFNSTREKRRNVRRAVTRAVTMEDTTIQVCAYKHLIDHKLLRKERRFVFICKSEIR